MNKCTPIHPILKIMMGCLCLLIAMVAHSQERLSMAGDDFCPVQHVELPVIRQLFTDKTPDVNSYTADSPDELKKGGR